MIPDSPTSRFVTRTCLFIVAAVCPISVLAALYLLSCPTAFISWHNGAWLLVAWCTSESLFWVFCKINGMVYPPLHEHIVPSAEERFKLRSDCIQVLQPGSEAAKEFFGGWFRQGSNPASVQNVYRENIAEWYEFWFAKQCFVNHTCGNYTNYIG
jgi:hypothetical protein